MGDHFVDAARKLSPARLPIPTHDYLPLPATGPHADSGDNYLSAMGLAANFANVNRMMLGSVALRCLSEACGREVSGRLVYDGPHDLIWSDDHRHLHRKGTTPAETIADPNFPDGHPVIVPGSMGDASYVLKGLGSLASLCSANNMAQDGERHAGPVARLA